MNRVVLCLCSMALAAFISGCHGVKPRDTKNQTFAEQEYCQTDTLKDADNPNKQANQDAKDKPVKANTSDEAGKKTSDVRQNDLCEAINLADGYRRGYLRRAGQVSGTRDALGYSIIAASTLALYYGASPQPTRTTAAGAVVSSPDYAQRVRRLGAFAAGTYAYGQWGSPKARDLVYIDGARAMTCAVLKASPAIPAIAKDGDINRQLLDVEGARKAVIEVLKLPALTSEDIASAQPVLEESANLIDQASQLLADIAIAGPALRARVQLIDVAVRRRLVDSSPTFESLVALTASLPGISRSLNASLAPPTAAKAAGATASASGSAAEKKAARIREEKDRAAARELLRNAISGLSSVMVPLKAMLVPLAGIRSAIDSVEECSVGGGAQFSIAPAATNATLEVDKTYQVVITDPVGHPRASITGGQADAVVLGAMELTGKDHEYRVVVTGDKPTTDATKPILSIRSASGLSGADINLTVAGDAGAADEGEEDPEPPAQPRTDACDSADDCDFDAAFIGSPKNVLALQCHIGAPADCIMGPTTRNQLTAYRAKKGYPAGNFVDAQVKTDLSPVKSKIDTEKDPTRYKCPDANEKPVICPGP